MIQMPENKRNVPSVLTCMDGTDVRDSRRWFEKRRPEILELFRDQEYGRLPDMKDVEIKIRVADSRQGPNVMEGRAVRRTVEVEAIRGGNHFSFNFVVFIPVGHETTGAGLYHHLQPRNQGQRSCQTFSQSFLSGRDNHLQGICLRGLPHPGGSSGL